MAKDHLAEAEDCRPLFELMNRVRDLEPWQWMTETDIFGVQHPDTGEIGFVSVMGEAGEHYAISAYRDARGLYGFWHMQDVGPNMQPEDLLRTPHLQASFEDREMLDARDYQIIKSLGLKYRGRNAWPQFRSYRPGYAPWFIEKYEAEFLRYILEQVLVVAPRVQQQPKLLDPQGDHHYLVRVAQRDGDTLKWEDQIMPIENPAPSEITIDIEPGLFEMVEQLPRARYRLEADFFMLYSTVGERDERPYFPYALMMLDTTHDILLTTELLSPIPSLAAMWAKLGPTVLKQLIQHGAVPSEIRVSDKLLFSVLQPFAKALKLKVKRVRRLPMLDRARMELQAHMRRR